MKNNEEMLLRPGGEWTTKVEDMSSWIDLKEWSKYMDTVPVDPYVKEGFRFKTLGWFRVKRKSAAFDTTLDPKIVAHCNETNMDASPYVSSAPPSFEFGDYVVWHLPQFGLRQSASYNPVHGNMDRHYSEISASMTDREDFRRFLIRYAQVMDWEDDVVLLQFQRIDALRDRVGLPAVEGFHKDGNEHAVMLIIQRNNVSGAVSQVSKSAEGTDLVLDKILHPGEAMFWHDKIIWHYATELTVDPNGDKDRGVRDVVLMSAGGQQHFGSVKT